MPEKHQKQNVELRSEEVKDILGQIPHWIVRWGMVMLLIALALLLLGSWWFRYPDIIHTTVRVTTENPPYNAIARSDGKITTIFVKDNQEVDAGDVLALIENPAKFEDIQILQYELEQFSKLIPDFKADSEYIFNKNLSLGEIQPFSATFLKLYNDLLQNFRLDYHNQKINSLRLEITRYKDYSKRLHSQGIILKQEEVITRNQFKRDSLLFRQGVIPEAGFEESRSKVLQKQYAYEQSQITRASNEIQTSKLEQEILDLELRRNETNGKLVSVTMEALDNLVAAIAEWEQKYLLKSTVNGVVSFTRIWSENQFVRSGDMVMSVIPMETGKIIGKIDLPLAGSGKVKAGQLINIKFSNFPYLEYGMVRGVIRTISRVTSDNAYSVVVDLPQGLKTNYDIELAFNQDMQGSAEIITSDKNLLEKLVNPVKSALIRQRRD